MTKVFKRWLMVVVALFILSAASCVPAGKVVDQYTTKVSYDAELIQAYKTFEKCGSKNHYACEVFYGKLRLKDSGMVVQRELDGFLYQNFEKADGTRPVLAYVTMSRKDFGESPPLWASLLNLTGALICLMLLISLFYGMLELPEKVKTEIKNRR